MVDEQPPGGVAWRIVVGVDGSLESREALHFAIEEQRVHGGEVRVVHAWSYPFQGLGSGFTPAPYVLPQADELDTAAAETLDRAIQEVCGPSRPAQLSTHVVEGSPGRVLVDAANDADLLVVGARGHGGFRGLLLGSVSEQVVRHARCSVLVVRPPTAG